jgi:hypothetical protein
MPRRERLTVEVDYKLRKSLARWAREEGRPVGTLCAGLLPPRRRNTTAGWRNVDAADWDALGN